MQIMMRMMPNVLPKKKKYPNSIFTYPKGFTPGLIPAGVKRVLVRVIQTISGHTLDHALKRVTATT